MWLRAVALAGVLAGCAARLPPPRVVHADAARDDQCRQFLADLPADVQRGWLEVPEDPDDPRSPRLRLFYFGRYSRAPDAPLPALVFHGGPGGESSTYYEWMHALFEERKIPYLLFDQRGAGCSTRYPALTAASAGRYAFYGSRQTVRDAEALRRELFGQRPWRVVFGHSFGAKVALRYVADVPRSVERVVIAGDSVPDEGSVVCALREQITRNRAAFSAAFAARADLGPLVLRLERELSTVCYTDAAGFVRVCGLDLLGWMGTDLSPADATWLAVALGTLQRNGAVDWKIVDTVAQSAWRVVDARVMLVVIQDYPLFLDGRSTCTRALAEAPPTPGGAPRAFGFCDLQRNIDSLPRRLRAAGPLLTWTAVRRGLAANPALTVLELHGDDDERDPRYAACPPRAADRPTEASPMPRWTTVNIPHMDHSRVLAYPPLYDALAP